MPNNNNNSQEYLLLKHAKAVKEIQNDIDDIPTCAVNSDILNTRANINSTTHNNTNNNNTNNSTSTTTSSPPQKQELFVDTSLTNNSSTNNPILLNLEPPPPSSSLHSMMMSNNSTPTTIITSSTLNNKRKSRSRSSSLSSTSLLSPKAFSPVRKPILTSHVSSGFNLGFSTISGPNTAQNNDPTHRKLSAGASGGYNFTSDHSSSTLSREDYYDLPNEIPKVTSENILKNITSNSITSLPIAKPSDQHQSALTTSNNLSNEKPLHMQKEYALNEKIYLSKLRKAAAKNKNDDYYTRRISLNNLDGLMRSNHNSRPHGPTHNNSNTATATTSATFASRSFTSKINNNHSNHNNNNNNNNNNKRKGKKSNSEIIKNAHNPSIIKKNIRVKSKKKSKDSNNKNVTNLDDNGSKLTKKYHKSQQLLSRGDKLKKSSISLINASPTSNSGRYNLKYGTNNTKVNSILLRKANNTSSTSVSMDTLHNYEKSSLEQKREESRANSLCEVLTEAKKSIFDTEGGGYINGSHDNTEGDTNSNNNNIDSNSIEVGEEYSDDYDDDDDDNNEDDDDDDSYYDYDDLQDDDSSCYYDYDDLESLADVYNDDIDNIYGVGFDDFNDSSSSDIEENNEHEHESNELSTSLSKNDNIDQQNDNIYSTNSRKIETRTKSGLQTPDNDDTLTFSSSTTSTAEFVLPNAKVHQDKTDHPVLENFQINKKSLLEKLSWIKDSDNDNNSNDNDKGEVCSKDSLELSVIGQNPRVLERLEWQMMLYKVLKGDIVRNEKSKLAKLKEKFNGNTTFKDTLWIELKAWMNGHTVEEQTKSLQILKNTVADEVIDKIMQYKVENADNKPIFHFVNELKDLLDTYYQITSYWPNLSDLRQEKPITASFQFEQRLATFNLIVNLDKNLTNEVLNLCQYTDLGKYFDPETHNFLPICEVVEFQINKSLADQIVTERDIELIFQKKIFFKHAPWIIKSKICYVKYGNILKELGFPLMFAKISVLLRFPIKLIKEVIKVRLDYAEKLENPTMMMIDQIIDDMSTYVKLATQIKYTIEIYKRNFTNIFQIDEDFDDVVIDAILFIFKLLNLKLFDSSKSVFRTFKEPDELIKHWDNLKNIGIFLSETAGLKVARAFATLSLRFMTKLHNYIIELQTEIPNFKNQADVEKWLSECLENVGTIKRKLNRFINVFSNSVCNMSIYQIKNKASFLDLLKDSGHVLFYTGGKLENDKGVYLIGSSELINCSKEDILEILNNSQICSDLVPVMEVNNNLNIYNVINEEIFNVDDENDLYMEQYAIDGTYYYHMEMPDYISRSFSAAASNPGKTSRTVNNFAGEVAPDISQKQQSNGIDFGFADNTTIKNVFIHNRDRNSNYFDDYAREENELYELEMKLKSLGYLIVISPKEVLLWKGRVVNLSEPICVSEIKLPFNAFFKGVDSVPISTKSMSKPANASSSVDDRLLFLTQGSCYAMDYQRERFEQTLDSSAEFLERACSIKSIDITLKRINRVIYKMVYSLLSSYPSVVVEVENKLPGMEILNSGYMFCKDFARNFLLLNTSTITNTNRSELILVMIQLSISWIKFIVNDCNPTDLKTFRWSVLAMEFAMQVTSGYNILALDSKDFADLKQQISGCMSLLISHFDIMGGRSRALAESKLSQQQKMSGSVSIDEYDDDAVLAVNSQIRMQSIRDLEKRTAKKTKHKAKVGKVLDDTDREDLYLAKLASSLSNVSIRWQKRSFIGGGSFGDVFSAVNLDTGGILAVKQIKVQHSKSMEKIFPRIKDEMTVLELLNHPNIVQYYGVEVHRDKVNIFMEYCEGGSLATLLEHGRFEDETITQVYSLQLLEGLAYLHHSGVVHRDIKPDNILLDYSGVIKYVDFGAAKLITKNATVGNNKSDTPVESKNSTNIKKNTAGGGNLNSLMGTPMYMAPENITGAKHGRFGSDDIWSLGCVILEMVTGRRPWSNLDNEWAIMYHVAAGHVPPLPTRKEMSDLGINFLSKFLLQDPDKRATAVELLLHPWIVEIRMLAFGTDEQSEVSLLNTSSSTSSMTSIGTDSNTLSNSNI
ncbi:uncharacterized protein SCODWIG_00587 [Saccharomycodes ludwigii]|uniref:Protein kinase domain-containing protein n=1 Tax=Saccharomycodes ludwigii TaxID=36035 RepID=A0A376B2B4_9ASCO|nr:hypothetical protein SCDLUD_003740 [Saccharomycodes ludwigii]KAH3900735.1 hypothetical protein SCDLUD_003740 [Saccharomycodes ludwigii]SSD58826.1 uncharacterized protein SCODWIG_00587 [Saccharomycodes ludwigii]